VRIGELARQIGVTPDTVRFYEREGWLPRAGRGENGYREYTAGDAEHLRLLIDLRRLDVPLEDAARLARSCHTGHCADSTAELPEVIAARRAAIAARMDGLRALDARLAELERHLATTDRSLPVAGGAVPCCDAAGEIVRVIEGSCDCCVGTPA
jgi:DNA-binding transcriptional MerR regulator